MAVRRTPPRVGNRAFRKLARTSGNKTLGLAAGALRKSVKNRSAAEKSAIKRTAATRAVLKSGSKRTGAEKRGLSRARASYARSVNRMGDTKRFRLGMKGKISRPKGYAVAEDYSMGKGKRGNYPSFGKRRPGATRTLTAPRRGLTTRQVAAQSGIKIGGGRRRGAARPARPRATRAAISRPPKRKVYKPPTTRTHTKGPVTRVYKPPRRPAGFKPRGRKTRVASPYKPSMSMYRSTKRSRSGR